MSEERKNTTINGGIGFGGALLLTFIILKLTKVINWSWLWILSPLWIPVALLFIILGIVAVIAFFKKGDN